MIQLLNIDCMEYMRTLPDKYFDLAITDPMYIMPKNFLTPGKETSKTTNGKRKHVAMAKELAGLPPTGMDYYNELLRVSKDQIIWGINYYPFAGLVPGRIVWDKKNDSSNFSNCELASCSLITGVRIFRHLWNGMLQENMKQKEIRIHAFQKPVALYKWCLDRFAKPGFKILDTHLGSASSAIAAVDYGFEFTGLELDKAIFDNAIKRFDNHMSQQNLFATDNIR